MAKKKTDNNSDVGANREIEQTLPAAAYKLRANMDAAERKRAVLGLIVLKYKPHAFDELHQIMIAGEGNNRGAEPLSATNNLNLLNQKEMLKTDEFSPYSRPYFGRRKTPGMTVASRWRFII